MLGTFNVLSISLKNAKLIAVDQGWPTYVCVLPCTYIQYITELLPNRCIFVSIMHLFSLTPVPPLSLYFYEVTFSVSTDE